MFSTVQVGKAIRQARMAKDMTQTALADELGGSYQAVSNWERGSSMPDIAKLPDLCRILDVSFEKLMGTGEETRIVRKAVEEPNTPLTLDELTEIAPILPPKKLGEDTKANADNPEGIKLTELLKLAPFLDDKYLDQLVRELAVEDLGDLSELAPFLSDQALDALVERCQEQPGSMDKLISLAPFLSDEAMDRLLEGYDGPLDGVVGLAPFASDDALDQLVRRSLQAGSVNVEQLAGLFPFLSDNALHAIADHLLGKRDLNGLAQISPFL